jgi:HK97 family phage portal protein
MRGVSSVEALKENFGLALALEKFASTFFGQGTNLAGVIEFPGNLTAEQAENLRNGFDSKHKGWRRGHRRHSKRWCKFKTTQVDPESSQSIEARRLAVEDVARAFNIPAHLLNIPGTNNLRQRRAKQLQFITHTLRPIVQKLEDAFSPLDERVTLVAKQLSSSGTLTGLLALTWLEDERLQCWHPGRVHVNQ